MSAKRKVVSAVVILTLAVVLAAMLVIAAELPSGRAEYLVPKITCIACSETINQGLRGVAGVASVEVDVPNRLVKVAFDEKRTNAGDLALELGRLGYPGTLVGLGAERVTASTALGQGGKSGCACCAP